MKEEGREGVSPQNSFGNAAAFLPPQFLTSPLQKNDGCLPATLLPLYHTDQRSAVGNALQMELMGEREGRARRILQFEATFLPSADEHAESVSPPSPSPIPQSNTSSSSSFDRPRPIGCWPDRKRRVSVGEGGRRAIGGQKRRSRRAARITKHVPSLPHCDS